MACPRRLPAVECSAKPETHHRLWNYTVWVEGIARVVTQLELDPRRITHADAERLLVRVRDAHGGDEIWGFLTCDALGEVPRVVQRTECSLKMPKIAAAAVPLSVLMPLPPAPVRARPVVSEAAVRATFGADWRVQVCGRVFLRRDRHVCPCDPARCWCQFYGPPTSLRATHAAWDFSCIQAD